MLHESYRPRGWLGIMLGSRLYYEFTEVALSNDEDWERVADGVAQEVRRHGGLAPSSGPATITEARPQEAVEVVAVATAAPSTIPKVSTAVPPPPMREAAVASVSVGSAVHNSNETNFNSNDKNSSINNITNIKNVGNTSIVLL